MNNLQVSIQTSCTVTATVKTRINLALHHLFAACRFAARLQAIEQEYSGQAFGEFWEEAFHNGLGVATLTVAALECYANEMYFEGSILGNTLTPAAAQELAQLVDKESVLRKYSMALAVRGGKQLDFGLAPVQNVEALIKLRNSVVHFRPEWFGEGGKHEKLSKVLQHKFLPSAFLPNEPIFPRSWASASFATWALQSTVAFLEYFYNEVDITCPLRQFKTQLSSLSNNAI